MSLESQPCLGEANAHSPDNGDQSVLQPGQSRKISWRLLLGGALGAGLLVSGLMLARRSSSQETESEFKDTVSLSESTPASRRGSFLVLGDWGWDEWAHAPNLLENRCQKLIAEKMLETMRELGDVQFIINVGDSFYPNGVKSKQDPQWWTKWRNIYDQELRNLPWYSVYGNHDYNGDASCACGSNPQACAQFNADFNNRNFFYMPNLNWNREHPELGLEVVALDMNAYEWTWNRYPNPDEMCSLEPCANTPCQEQCELNLKYRAKDGFGLLKRRIEDSSQKNLLVFSHYPSDYFWNETMTPMLSLLRDNSKHHIEYFGGHRHSTDDSSVASTWPNHNWLVGGGGGWSCDSPQQGFVVGEIDMDYNLTTYSVLVPTDDCCDKTTTTTDEPEEEEDVETERRLWGKRKCKLAPDFEHWS
mmetsp:Transcript_71737/g.126633  ORF Transcript_71737/g.126633 Transcript_71737/m.126633 type:complete len:418 (+) Transcript_71737:71-1324(+)